MLLSTALVPQDVLQRAYKAEIGCWLVTMNYLE